MSGTIFFICLTSAISIYSLALRISAWPGAPKRWRKGCKNRKEKTGSWQSQSRRWTWSHLSRQVLRLCRIRLRRKARGYWKHPVEQIGQIQGNLTRKNTIKMQFWMLETRRDRRNQEHLNYPEDSVSTRKLVASGNSETEGSDKAWPDNLHNLHYALRMEKVFSIVRQRWSQPDGSNEGPRCEHSCTTQEILETVISSDWEVDHGSDRNDWTDHDWLEAAYVERQLCWLMYNDIDWRKRGNKENGIANWVCSKIHARTLVVSWYGTRVNKPDGEWEKTAKGMMLNVAESGHLVFRASSALQRGELRKIHSLQR